MAKRKNNHQIPSNFIDLRQPVKKPKNALIHDVITPWTTIKPRNFIIIAILLLIVSGLVTGAILLSINTKTDDTVKSHIPTSIRNAITFPVYVLDSSTLPSGYSINNNSYVVSGDALIFEVLINNNEKITVTEQRSPSSQAIANFESQRLPLYTNVQTRIGVARVGSYNGASLTSLPTPNTWLLISAPYAIKSTDLEQFLKSFTQ